VSRPPQLDDQQIASVCQELAAASGGAVPARTLQRALRARYGRVGDTGRMLRVRRLVLDSSEVRSRQAASAIADLESRTAVAEARAAAAEEGRRDAERMAVLSIEREALHSAKWMREVDSLRQRLKDYSGAHRRVAELEQQILTLRQKIAALERRSAGHNPAP
jgi:hypothetical protein